MKVKVSDSMPERPRRHAARALPPLRLLQMAMETPTMDPQATMTIVLHWIDIGTTIVFWAEVSHACFGREVGLGGLGGSASAWPLGLRAQPCLLGIGVGHMGRC